MAERKAAIKGLKLTIDSKDLHLSLQAAEQLFEALKQLFEKQVIVKEVHTHHHDYPRWWYQPRYHDQLKPSLTPNITYCTSFDAQTEKLCITDQRSVDVNG